MQVTRKEIPAYADPIYRPPPTPTEIPLQVIPRKLKDLDIDTLEEEINMDFEKKCPTSGRYDIWNVPKSQ